MIDWARYPSFKKSEFVCHCGCGRADMDPAFLDWLQSLRNDIGLPLTITSGFRCPDHNVKVASSGRTGPHTSGKAADIAIRGEPAAKLIQLALNRSVRGLGINQKGAGRFIHLDTIERPYRAIWSY